MDVCHTHFSAVQVIKSQSLGCYDVKHYMAIASIQAGESLFCRPNMHMSTMNIAMCTCTSVSKFCNPHGFLLSFMFYVCSDVLVHLQISTEYIRKSCRTVDWVPCQGPVEVKVQQSNREKWTLICCIKKKHTFWLIGTTIFKRQKIFVSWPMKQHYI